MRCNEGCPSALQWLAWDDTERLLGRVVVIKYWRRQHWVNFTPVGYKNLEDASAPRSGQKFYKDDVHAGRLKFLFRTDIRHSRGSGEERQSLTADVVALYEAWEHCLLRGMAIEGSSACPVCKRKGPRCASCAGPMCCPIEDVFEASRTKLRPDGYAAIQNWVN